MKFQRPLKLIVRIQVHVFGFFRQQTFFLQKAANSPSYLYNAEYPATWKLLCPYNSGYVVTRLHSLIRLGFEIRIKFIHRVSRSKFFNPTMTLMEKRNKINSL